MRPRYAIVQQLQHDPLHNQGVVSCLYLLSLVSKTQFRSSFPVHLCIRTVFFCVKLFLKTLVLDKYPSVFYSYLGSCRRRKCCSLTRSDFDFNRHFLSVIIKPLGIIKCTRRNINLMCWQVDQQIIYLIDCKQNQ